MMRPVLAAATLLVLTACAAPVMVTSAISIAQLGTTTFNNGSLETVYPQPFSAVVAAVRKMVADLDLTVDVDRPQRGFLYLDVTDLTGSSISIRVKQRTASLTSIHIRVGTFGDQPYSTAIMSRVAGNMKPQDTDPTVRPAPGEEKSPLSAPPPVR
jgi:hypothetical protein